MRSVNTIQRDFTYDENGNQLSMTDALGHTTSFEYDANNCRTKTIYADTTFDAAGYDDLGRNVSKTDQAGKTTQFFYDELGRLKKVKDALNQETTYSYNELSHQRHRELRLRVGRFWTTDSYEGRRFDPGSLHRRLRSQCSR